MIRNLHWPILADFGEKIEMEMLEANISDEDLTEDLNSGQIDLDRISHFDIDGILEAPCSLDFGVMVRMADILGLKVTIHLEEKGD